MKRDLQDMMRNQMDYSQREMKALNDRITSNTTAIFLDKKRAQDERKEREQNMQQYLRNKYNDNIAHNKSRASDNRDHVSRKKTTSNMFCV